MRDYEIVYIFKSGFTPEEIERKLERYHGVLTGADGEITAVEQWGKRQLAYPIRKESNGYYVIAQFTTEPAALAELERVLKLDEDLLRHLIVLSEGELPRLVRLEEGGAVDEDEDDEFDEDEEEEEDEDEEDEEEEDEEDEDEEDEEEDGEEEDGEEEDEDDEEDDEAEEEEKD